MQRPFGPVGAVGRHAPGVGRRSLVPVDFAAGNGDAEQVLVDGITAGGCRHLDSRLGHDLQLVVPNRLHLCLQVANRRMNFVLAEAAHGLVEAQLVVAHAGAAVSEVARTEPIAQLEAALDDQVAVRTQQGILAAHARVAPHQRDHEFVPDRLGHVDLVVLGGAQADGPLADVPAARLVHATGVDKRGMHLETLLHQVQDTVAGVQAAGEGQNDFLLHDRLFPNRVIMTAFCTCRRFSASSSATQ